MRGIRALVLGALGLVAPDAAAADQPLCVYHNQSYSDGAHICIQRQLMMACAAEGERATWRIVEDSRLAGLCSTPLTAGRLARAEPPPVRWSQPPRKTSGPAHVRNSAKCFVFMGRRFCE